MAKDTKESGGFWGELLRSRLYKRNQGRITRQTTFGAIAVVVVLACWRMLTELETARYGWMFSLAQWIGLAEDKRAFWANYRALQIHYWLPLLVLASGLWVTFRLVNWPAFADFLIAVEAEMNKVSWPTRKELIRSSIVVLAVIFLLAAVLFVYDYAWSEIFWRIGVLHRSTEA